MDSNKILIISDNANLARLIRDFLLQSDFEPTITNTKNALSAAALNPDLIILHTESEDELFDSLTLLEIPVFVLISERRSADRIMFLERGASDIMTVPFDAREVVARSRALLRRMSAPKSKQMICELEGLTVDLNTYTITCEDSRKEIPAKETELLFLLATNIGRVFRRRDIMSQIWHTTDISERIVDMHISKLRGAISESRCWEIAAVRGVGYKFVKKS
ncbi:MAG: response regulator transcription factor [Oscillospiraceae bacterium]